MARKRIIIFAAAVIFILAGTLAAIFYIRGFKIDTKKGITRTGLLVIDSTPDGAQVFLDDRLTSATDTTITFLNPKKYKLKLVKEGFSTWEKETEIRADLATEVKAILFPSIPDLRPLTFTGATNVQLAPDRQKLVFGIEKGEKAGLWILDLADRPFGLGKEPRQIVQDTPTLKFSTAILTFSPESKIIWAQLAVGGRKEESARRNFLLDSDKLNENLQDATATLLTTLAAWQQDINLKEQIRLKRLTKDLPEIASQSAPLLDLALKEATGAATLQPSLLNYHPDNLIWSPDETKFLVIERDSKDKIIGATVFKIKDPNPLKITPAKFEIPAATSISWYADSDHLILVEEDKISIIEYEGTNKMTVFTGSFEGNVVFTHPNGASLIILTSLTQATDTPPNLYSLKLR